MSNTMLDKKKRRVLGEVITPGSVSHTHAQVDIHTSSRQDMVTYESEGFVVAINGSGTLDIEHAQCQEAAQLAQWIISEGGVVINGGRSSGIMAASSQAADQKNLGILFPEIQPEQNENCVPVVVNSPQPRIELLSTCAPITVVFRGGLGTLMALMRSIVHVRNREYHPEQLPQTVFISNYWLGLLTSMKNLGALPSGFVKKVHFFNTVEDIKKTIPSIIQ